MLGPRKKRRNIFLLCNVLFYSIAVESNVALDQVPLNFSVFFRCLSSGPGLSHSENFKLNICLTRSSLPQNKGSFMHQNRFCLL